MTTTPILTFREAVELRVASADQQHLVRRVSAVHPYGRTVAGHTWYRTLAEKVGARMLAGRDVTLCPHIGPGRPLVPMHCTYTAGPMEVQCRDCMVADPPRLGPVDDNTCDRCNVYSRRGLMIGMLPIGPLLIGFGVCTACTDELGASRPGIAA